VEQVALNRHVSSKESIDISNHSVKGFPSLESVDNLSMVLCPWYSMGYQPVEFRLATVLSFGYSKYHEFHNPLRRDGRKLSLPSGLSRLSHGRVERVVTPANGFLRLAMIRAHHRKPWSVGLLF
jgi:hypothetical protein